MKLPLEIIALGWALLAGFLSLGGAWMLSVSIKPFETSSPSAIAETAPTMSGSAELVAQGGNFFAMSCSHCHGDDAHGDEGPDLHNLTISNARIAATIKKGVKGEMPTFAKKYNDKDIAALTAYLRSLR